MTRTHAQRLPAAESSGAGWVQRALWAKGRNRDVFAERRRVRRIAAAVTGGSGLIAIVSALTPPLQRRAQIVRDVFPIGAAHTANALVAAAGVGLVVLAWAVLRGQRRAWWMSMAVLTFLLVGHVVKGVDLEEALGAAAAGLYLGSHGDAFRAHSQLRAGRHALATLGIGLVVAFGGSFLAIEAATLGLGRKRMHARQAAHAVLESVGSTAPSGVPHLLAGFLRPALIGTGVSVTLLALWLALRPVIARVVEQRHRTEIEERARSIIGAHGGGTLDYFALRDDKTYFFHEQSVISYAIYGSVCLVSPDPIGPAEERVAAWTERVGRSRCWRPRRNRLTCTPSSG